MRWQGLSTSRTSQGPWHPPSISNGLSWRRFFERCVLGAVGRFNYRPWLCVTLPSVQRPRAAREALPCAMGCWCCEQLLLAGQELLQRTKPAARRLCWSMCRLCSLSWQTRTLTARQCCSGGNLGCFCCRRCLYQSLSMSCGCEHVAFPEQGFSQISQTSADAALRIRVDS